LTAQGHPRAVFRRAIERGNLLVAETTAREMGTVSLQEALALTGLIALKEPHRRSRVAARWLLRFLEEHDAVTIEEAMLAGAALTALGTDAQETAITVLTDMSERATRDQRKRRVAS
jgi:ribosomal protein S7